MRYTVRGAVALTCGVTMGCLCAISPPLTAGAGAMTWLAGMVVPLVIGTACLLWPSGPGERTATMNDRAAVRALVAALPRCHECRGAPATYADHGPDGPDYFTCDACEPTVTARWQEASAIMLATCGLDYEPIGRLSDVAYAGELRTLLERMRRWAT